MLYIGSCRYMYDYNWNHFRARLHTTREILYFLENINNIDKLVEKTFGELIGLIFGDLFNPQVVYRTPTYLKNGTDDLSSVKKLVLEISSRKLYYYNNIPLNYYCTSYNPDLITKYGLTVKELSDTDIIGDLIRIKNLSKDIFHKDVVIHIIPHLNLKLKATGAYIPKRDALVKLLMIISARLDFQFHNIGLFLELIKNDTAFLEHYMADHTHYSNGYEHVNALLNHRICL